jgi:hypothetical protein
MFLNLELSFQKLFLHKIASRCWTAVRDESSFNSMRVEMRLGQEIG